ncbi:MAG: hypothetical protein GXY47_02175 [Acidobacteria bacterium]|nr:hypothetical protein [Acidobacteriota bacterium]
MGTLRGGGGAAAEAERAGSARSAVTYLAIPRPWFISLLVILVAPWLAVAAFLLKPEAPAEGRPPDPAQERRVGRWGKLTLLPIVIAPPMELVFTDWGFSPHPAWFFPGTDADGAVALLRAVGVPGEDADRLRGKMRTERRTGGVLLLPDPAWVRGLEPGLRGRLYHLLAGNGFNPDQVQAFRFRGASLEEWLGGAMIDGRTRGLVEPLVYRDGDYMLFSDIELVRAEIGEEELRRLGKGLFRQRTVLAGLSVGAPGDLDALVEYWGRGGRRTEIRPLLESISRGESETVDVVHLLPPFARDRLYSYPQLSVADLDRPTVANCLWTALNFFSSRPDDRFLDDAVALRTLREDYFIVEGELELGDIIAFVDESGDFFHAVVQIADNLVFSKNGISALSPWTLMTLEEVKGYYRWRSENPRLIVHRRKGL